MYTLSRFHNYYKKGRKKIMKFTKKMLSLFLAIAMVFSVISPSFVLDVNAESTALKYATNDAATITNGTGKIDASSDVDSYKNLEEATINLTATFSGSGVQSMFFLGNSTVSTNYYTWYLSGNTLGVEVYNASNSKVINKTVVLSNMDFTKEHKYSLVHAKNGTSYTLTMYVDGAVVLSDSVSAAFSEGTLEAANYVGYGNGARQGNTYPMSGTIKDVEFYNSALSVQEVMDYVTKDRSDLVMEARNITASTSGTALDSEAVNTLKALNQGTINIRYRVGDASVNEKMSLLKVTSSTSNNVFEVWVNPGANTYGLNVNGTNMPITNHSGVNDTKWHTITIRSTQDDTKIGDNPGLHLTLDGNYIEGNRYTGNGRYGLFTLVNGADSFVVASENFDGAIDLMKVYSGVLDNDEVSAKDVICELSNEILVYSYDGSGKLPQFELIQRVSTSGDEEEVARAASGLRVSPTNQYLYCSTAGEETAGIFKIDQETGMLEKICILPISGKYPKDVAVFPDEKTLISVNHESNEIRFFRIDYEKKIFVMKGKPIKIETPNCILISKVGEYNE